MLVKDLARLNSSNTYEELKLNYELGFITEGTLLGVETMLIQATNDYFTAYRDYMTAITTLDNSSMMGGPAFGGASAQGGMTFE